MKNIYDLASYRSGKIFTNLYSTSFSLGILGFSKKIRKHIYAIYGFVRLADEIVDTFFDYNQKEMFERFKQDLDYALKNGISLNPILNSFALTVKEYNIDRKYIDAFMKSMEMDLYKNYHERDSFDEYVYGSAEVVGLMCLKVFVNNNQSLFDELVEPARALGSAFQKVNFLRDIQSDLKERKRIYLPNVDKEFLLTDSQKKKLEEETEKEFEKALSGILRLPLSSRIGVYAAYLYYYQLFNKIKNTPLDVLLKERVRISNFQKIVLFVFSFFKNYLMEFRRPVL